MRLAAVAEAREKAREGRRQRVVARHGRLLRAGKSTKEAVAIIAEEEARSPKTIYSILEGWR